MSDVWDVEDRWPELFQQLTPAQYWSVRQALASAWHEGWEPVREDVENITDYTRGALDEAEYFRRVREAAHRARSTEAR